MSAQSYKAVADFDSEPGYILWVARGKDLFPHDEFWPFIGDIIHNLRDALDLAISVLMRNANLSDVGVQFPTADSLSLLKKAIVRQGKKEPFPPKIVDVLETRIEPYSGARGQLLRVLHNIAIRDKHRMIVPTVFGVDVVEMQSEGMDFLMHVFGARKTIRDGSVLARVSASYFPNVQVGHEAKVTLAITFDDRSRSLQWESIEAGTRRLLYATEDAIECLETCL
jgi:hypothetical protein